jgi:hypothetical protein
VIFVADVTASEGSVITTSVPFAALTDPEGTFTVFAVFGVSVSAFAVPNATSIVASLLAVADTVKSLDVAVDPRSQFPVQ